MSVLTYQTLYINYNININDTNHHSKRLLLEDRVALLLLLFPFFFYDLVITLLTSLDTLVFPGVLSSNADTSHSS